MKKSGGLNNNNSSTSGAATTQSTLPAQNHNFSAFASDEKMLEFKSALKQENRIEILKGLVGKAPRLELKVRRIIKENIANSNLFAYEKRIF